ncbi:Lrp/AsnC family transcriptional regulator [Bosea eneae]|uniref:Lrp/AsnC family transcriptional regulator n=1 Tax=Bosea eneae TaxID=151454 RepID=A0ABW0J1U0_9HYPH
MTKSDLRSSERRLLDLVQRDATASVESLAEGAGMSASTAQRRLRGFRADGTITAEVAVLDPGRCGYPTTFLVELELDHDRPERLPALHDWIRADAHVQSAWQVTGDADYLLVVQAASVEAFDAWSQAMMTANRNVRKFTTSVALKTLKRSLRVPVGLEP